MTLGPMLRSMLREARGGLGRTLFLVACLAIGVAAVVGVAALVRAMESGIASQSRRLLAADLEISSRRPLPEVADETVRALAPSARRVTVHELVTLVGRRTSDGVVGSRLVELKAVQGDYPFYGELVLDPPDARVADLHPSTVFCAPELLAGLGMELGDELVIGRRPYRVAAAILEEPDRLDVSFTMGPRVLVSGAGLERAGLLGVGSRVRYAARYALPGHRDRAALEVLAERVRDAVRAGPEATGRVRVRTHHDGQPSVRRALERVQRYLGLVALLSLVLGGLGVAQIVRAWIAARIGQLAILRCLGWRPREVFLVTFGHLLLVALLASLLGGALGLLVPVGLARLIPDLVPAELLDPWQPLAMTRGVLLGVGIAALFALAPLLELWRISPARVLRAEVEPLPPRPLVRWGARLALAGGLLGCARWQAESWDRAAAFTGGLVALAGLLALAARGLSRLAARVPRGRLGPTLRWGIAALARPSAGTTGAIVALGVGVMVVLAMALVEQRVGAELGRALPEDAPSVFFVDVQPDQWPPLETLLAEQGARAIDSVPVVMARLSAIDGVPVGELRGRYGRSEWVLTREQRLTWVEQLPEDNEIVAGALWSEPRLAEVSIEEEFARDLGVDVGARLTFDVQGVPVTLHVTSLRSVEWQSFAINFFLVVEPGVLEDAPHMRIAAARLPEAAESRVQDRLVADFGNVTMLPVRPILEKVLALMRRVALGVRVLGAFTIAAGLVILAGAVASTAVRRGGEVALLKTLGVTRGGVVRLLAVEYALCGAVAGLVGAVGALVLTWGFLEHVVEWPAELPLPVLPAAVVASAGLAVVFGLAASAQALAARPWRTLRQVV